MTPLRTMPALLLLVVCVLLAAGCIGGDDIKEQDLVIVKLTADGNTSWIKTVDSGNDDIVTDLLQTSDENYIIAGGNSVALCNFNWQHYPTTPTLTWMSGNGDIISQRNYSFGVPDGFIALFLGSDGSYRAISLRHIISKIDQNGNVIWNRSVDLSGAANYFLNDNGDFDIIMQNGTIRRVSPDGTIIMNATSINQTKIVSPRETGLYTCDDPMTCTQTSDGGYVSVESVKERKDEVIRHHLWTRFRALKINNNGIVAWHKDIASFENIMGVGKTSLKKIIQTQDGGYLLAFENEKVCSCSGC